MSDQQMYDTPPEQEVHQDTDPERFTVPVEVRGSVRTDEMPTKLGGCRNIIFPAGAPAVKILNGDPHRKSVVMWAFSLGADCDGVCIAGTSGEADAFSGAILHPGTGLLRYEFTFQDELWARPLLIAGATPTWVGYDPSGDDCILSIVVEQWAR